MPPIRSPRTASPTSPCGWSRRSPGGAGCAPRWRSGAITSCPMRRRSRSPMALLAAEMGMNLQMALGQKTYLLLHAATVERDGRALILTGESGAGKSTLAALLGERGWRLMGDEFAPARSGDWRPDALSARGQPQERRDPGDGDARSPPTASDRGSRTRPRARSAICGRTMRRFAGWGRRRRRP